MNIHTIKYYIAIKGNRQLIHERINVDKWGGGGTETQKTICFMFPFICHSGNGRMTGMENRAMVASTGEEESGWL